MIPPTAHLALLHAEALECHAGAELLVRPEVLGVVHTGASTLAGARGLAGQHGCLRLWLHLGARTCELGQELECDRFIITAEGFAAGRNLLLLSLPHIPYLGAVHSKRLSNDWSQRTSSYKCSSCFGMGLCLSKPEGAKYAAPVGKAGLEPAPQPQLAAAKAPAASAPAEPTKEEMIGNLMPCAAPPPTELIGNLIDPITGGQNNVQILFSPVIVVKKIFFAPAHETSHSSAKVPPAACPTRCTTWARRDHPAR